MDEQVIQQAKVISRKIVEKEFPEEKEYFDFLFNLTIQEIEELEPGKEEEFLRQMRAVHPELVLGYTPIIIILTIQVLGDFAYHTVATRDIIKKRIAAILGDNNSREASIILNNLDKYLEQLED
ncbi:MAG: hypothetical protein HXS48_11890 [Theionarchaea archaeon]|nr:hypothetical protein [Theionarchaea archaeon]